MVGPTAFGSSGKIFYDTVTLTQIGNTNLTFNSSTCYSVDEVNNFRTSGPCESFESYDSCVRKQLTLFACFKQRENKFLVR